jgi:hypothetical protein
MKLQALAQAVTPPPMTERRNLMDANRIVRPSTKIFAAVWIGLYTVIAFLWTLHISLAAGLVWAAVFTLPVADVAWFILSLVLYLRAKKRGDEDYFDLKHRLKTSVFLLIFLAVMTALLIAFFAYAISHM